MRRHVPGMFAALTRGRNAGRLACLAGSHGVHCSLTERLGVVDEGSVPALAARNGRLLYGCREQTAHRGIHLGGPLCQCSFVSESFRRPCDGLRLDQGDDQ
jgi:hypothetical protein